MKRKNKGRADLLLGNVLEPRERLGFDKKPLEREKRNAVSYEGEAHLATIGKTGSGKGRSAVIPNLLTYEGSAVVLDVKGELYYTTARARREMNQDVILLDPFHWVYEKPDQLNPFDLLDLFGTDDLETEVQNLASLMVTKSLSKEPFWDISATALLSGVIAYIANCKPPSERNIESVVKFLHHEDLTYQMAIALDTEKKKMGDLAANEFTAFLNTAEVTRGGISPTANSYVKAFNSKKIFKSFSNSTFSLEDFIAGKKPTTVYIVIPPAYINSHFSLVRLWFYTLMKVFTNRREIPELPTIFFLDEVSQFGDFSVLENVMTIGRGYGIKVWLFLQSIHQLQQNYPKSWRTMLANCDIVQIFAVNDYMTARDLADLTGLAAPEIMRLKNEDQIVLQNGEPTKMKKLDYLHDEMFAGLFDDNPFYQKKGLKKN